MRSGSTIIAALTAVVLLGVPAWAQSLGIVQLIDTDTPGMARLDEPLGIAVSADGRNVYVTALEGRSLFAFSRDASTGLLVLEQAVQDGEDGVTGLARPRSVIVSPDGGHAYCMGWGFGHPSTVTTFRRHRPTGELEFVAAQEMLGGSLMFSPDGQYLYLGAYTVCSVDPATGELSDVQRLSNASGYSSCIAPMGVTSMSDIVAI